jgi:hypothetical protein
MSQKLKFSRVSSPRHPAVSSGDTSANDILVFRLPLSGAGVHHPKLTNPLALPLFSKSLVSAQTEEKPTYISRIVNQIAFLL